MLWSILEKLNSTMNYQSNGNRPPEVPEPSIMGYQMLGDSQLLRFSEKLLKKSRNRCNGDAFIGLCFSGQTIEELFHRVRKHTYPISEKLILMIGTNDLLQYCSTCKMCDDIEILVLTLISMGVEKLILLTIPPIPRVTNSLRHWWTLNQFNRTIKSFHNGRDIFVIDAYSHFFKKAWNSSTFYSSDQLVANCLSVCSTQEHMNNENNDCDDPYRNYTYKYNPFSDYTCDSNDLKYDSNDLSYDSNDLNCDSCYKDHRKDRLHMDFYEKYFDSGSKEDLIHLNYSGLHVIRQLILKKQYIS